MNRIDHDLAYILKFENIAWYEQGVVNILDRRIYPMQVQYVKCHTHFEVAQAIRDMVTQSEGPYLAAAMGMVLAMFTACKRGVKDISAYLADAASVLCSARPTTSAQMRQIVDGACDIAEQKLNNNVHSEEIIEALFQYALHYISNNYKRYTRIGEALSDLIPHNGLILTQCFGGTIVGTMLRACKKQEKQVKIYCAETRPYYQGARLTASVAYDMEFDVTVICDNMPAYTIQEKNIDVFTSASDVITMDGHIINKVGTFQTALACNYFGVPYYCTGTPDITHKDISTITIEERDPQYVTKSLDTKITMDGVGGYYPAFDITPPELCTGIVTDKGIFRPSQIKEYVQ